MKTTHFILCPVCKNKTRLKMREDTELKNFPLYCPKCKRTIMLPDFLIRELKDYFLKIEYFSEDEQIFPKCKTYFNKEMERGIKKSKVKKIKLHALRHSHISLLIEMGFTPVDIAARTGHESIKVLMDYSHMFPNKQLDMADKLDKEGEYSESTKISKL
ncbi:cysteine-rich KTR domain-containing protein [Treponema pedis]|uniref:Tyrosine-type recombinase/integrase n=1 Tax=Treponema pedis TaxID=409322 RepID=A0A7S7AX81_9SPIR|nr:tyrosine-type recombinase/integrase [Treponema pedis]